MTEKFPYFVTDPHATHVAGQRIRDADVRDGKKPVLLTVSEAEHELRAGYIRPAPLTSVTPKAKRKE